MKFLTLLLKLLLLNSLSLKPESSLLKSTTHSLISIDKVKAQKKFVSDGCKKGIQDVLLIIIGSKFGI